MSNLGALLDLSRSALTADQNALSVTSNNVANQNTPGYTRQSVEWVDGDLVTLSGASAGNGVSSRAVSQRDRILEQRVQLATQAAASSSAQQTALQQLQGLFALSTSGTNASSTTLGSAIEGLYGSFSSLSASPADTSVRQSVLAAAGTLVQAFNATANGIAQVTRGLDAQVQSIASQVNTLTSTIAGLNAQIASASPSGDGGALEDQRQLAITQLSQFVGLDQIAAGSNQFTLSLTNGAVLVSGATAVPVTTGQGSGGTQIYAGTDHENVTSAVTGGELGGILQARDVQIPSVSSRIDQLAYAIATQVNAANATGLDGGGKPGAALFTIPAATSGSAAAVGLITSDPQAVAAGSPGQGTGSNGNAVALAALASAPIAGGTQNASDFFASTLDGLGNLVSSASAEAATQSAALTAVTAQRDSRSAVSLDAEAADLTQYQRSYQAASKLFSIVDALYASALNLGVTTTVS